MGMLHGAVRIRNQHLLFQLLHCDCHELGEQRLEITTILSTHLVLLRENTLKRQFVLLQKSPDVSYTNPFAIRISCGDVSHHAGGSVAVMPISCSTSHDSCCNSP